VVTLVVVIFDEGADLAFKIIGQILVFQQHPVFHGLVPSLNLALSLGMERGSTNMIHLVIFQPIGQITRDVAGPVVAQQTRHVPYYRLITA
jgi:hypothetical protein